MGSVPSTSSSIKLQDEDRAVDDKDSPGELEVAKISLLQRFKLGAGREFFQEFPSLELLCHSQKVFSQQSYLIPSPGGVPVPHPSTGHREALLKQADLAAIYNHVQKVNSDWCFKYVPEAVAQITKTACNDLERVAAVFSWITTQDISKLTGDYDNKTAAYYLYKIHTGTGVYPQLMEQMCRCINVPCYTIRGWVKGSGYEPGDKFTKPSASWSAVLLSGHWWLLDCHWSAVYFANRGKSKDTEQYINHKPANKKGANITEKCSTTDRKGSDSYKNVSTTTERDSTTADNGPTTSNKSSTATDKGSTTSNTSSTTAGKGSTASNNSPTATDKGSPTTDKISTTTDKGLDVGIKDKFHDSFFLVDPWSMIYSHCPVKEEWQLLARPVTMEEFIELPCLEPLFFDLGFTNKQSKGLLQVEDDLVTISFEMPPKCTSRFSHRLTRVLKSSCETHFGEIPLEQFAFLSVDYTKMCTEIVLNLPTQGKYKYELFCEDSKHKVFNLIATYSVQNVKTVRPIFPFPLNTRSEWGPGRNMLDMGISPLTHTSGLVQPNGQDILMKFHTIHRTEFNHKLFGGQNIENSFHNFAFHEIQKDFVVYRIRLPEPGRYVFKLYARLQDSSAVEYPCVCSYLIKCNSASKLKPLPFLDTTSRNSAGATTHFRQLGLKFISAEKGYFETHLGELDLKFKIPSRLVLQSELCFGHKEEVLSQQTKFKIKGDTAIYHLEFPYVGMYWFTILGRTEGDIPDLKPVYRVLMEATRPKIGALPFPETLSGWKPNYEVVKPVHGLIATNKTIQIQVSIPDAVTVTVNSSQITQLTRNRSGTWSGAFSTGDNESRVSLTATFKTTSDENIPLLSYKVTSSEHIEKIIQEQKCVCERLKTSQGKGDNHRKGVTEAKQKNNTRRIGGNQLEQKIQSDEKNVSNQLRQAGKL